MPPFRLPRAVFLVLLFSILLTMVEYWLATLPAGSVDIRLLMGILTGTVVGSMVFCAGYLLEWCGDGVGPDEQRHLRLKRLLPPPLLSQHLRIVQSDGLTASTVCRGTRYSVFLSSGLIDALSDDGLRGVLAHEGAHIREQHPRRIAVIFALVASIKFSIGIPPLAVLALLLSFLYMTRSWEFHADALAAKDVGADCLVVGLQEFQVAAKDLPKSLLEKAAGLSYKACVAICRLLHLGSPDAFLEPLSGYPPITKRVLALQTGPAAI